MSNDLSAQPATVDATDLQTFDIMGAALVERGIMSAEAVAAERATKEAGGVSPGEGNKPPAQMAEAQQPGGDVWAPPASAAAYNFSPGGPLPEGATPSREFEMANREAFFAAGLPDSIGNELVRRYTAAVSKEPPSDHDLATGRQNATATLTKLWGADFKANLAAANSVVAKMATKQPAIWSILEKTGLGNDPWIIQSLANLANGRAGKP
jgi:hypothetical protein